MKMAPRSGAIDFFFDYETFPQSYRLHLWRGLFYNYMVKSFGGLPS